MGVTGLWRLIEPAGKPVPVETLENKVLAVDISIWLHQVVKGYQDARGAPLPNAHLMGLFQRLCKLLYFRIKPVFVFDGGFPELKRQTIAKRQDNKAKYNSESERLKREVLLLLSKKTAISNILGKEISPKKNNRLNSSQNSHEDDDIFKLPVLPPQEENYSTESESEDETSSGSIVDLHSVDIESESFKKLPVKEKYDLLLDLKDSRKMNSWGRLHELPKKSDNFSDFQMQRLLKRRKVQECLEETEKEMGDGCMSLNEIEFLLNADGIDTKIEKIPTQRIASSDTARILFIKDVKQTIAEAKIRQNKLYEANTVENNEPSTSENITKNKSQNQTDSNTKIDELDEDLKKAIQMSLECENEGNSSSFITVSNTSKSSNSCSLDSSCIESDYSESEHENEIQLPDMSSAKAYIMQYSDFTCNAIDKIVKCTKIQKSKAHSDNLERILKELEEEKSNIMAKINKSSDEDKVQNANDLTSQSKDESTFEDKEKECSSISLDNIVNDIFPGVKQKNNDISESDRFQKSDTLEGQVQNSTIITVNSSVDDTTSGNEQEYRKNISISSAESDSTDSDFEEVPDNNVNNTKEKFKPCVQLNLKLDEVLSDDIFADVFSDNSKNIIEEDTINKKYDKTEDTTKVENLKEIISTDTVIQTPIKSVNESTSFLQSHIECEDSIVIKDNPPKKEQIPTETFELEETSKKLTEENLNSIAQALDVEEKNIYQEKARLDRIGRNITEEMTKDVQELLQVFGIPYIVAPMEAEAQCAFLEEIKLTDGTITDDSDIWLFGGQTVYKNFFNQKKHVLQFLSDRINRSFNLCREKLVLLALLVGSDYTTGVTGVGPVTAMEILACFPYNKKEISQDTPRQLRYNQLIAGLQEFKKWIRTGKRTDNTNLKKKLKNVEVADDFPSCRVVEAYFEPNVDKREDTFTWGEIDITILRDYAKEKFGWSQSKLDEIINPVLKRLNDRKSQKTLENYFKKKTDYESLEDQMSKRVKAAVQKMGPGESIEDAISETKKTGKSKLKKKIEKDIIPNKRRKKNVKSTENNASNNETTDLVKSISEQSKSLQLLKKIPTVRVCEEKSTSSKFDIKVPKFDRNQEIIPQREKTRQCVLQNKLKAIEIFRKSKIDKKHVRSKKKVILPKDDAGLSESDSN